MNSFDVFNKFTSISKFSDTWKMMQRQACGQLIFRQKIKLHGTNAAIRVVGGKFTPQKRSSDLEGTMDNAGFAFWARSVNWDTGHNEMVYIIDGEWAGPGVQKSDAVSLIDKKQFFVFGVRVLIKPDYNDDLFEPYWMTYTCPNFIEDIVPDHPDIHVLPYYDKKAFPVNINEYSSAKEYQEYLEEEISKIEVLDPYIKEKFGVEGSGEGLVCFPDSVLGWVKTELYNTYVFKVKTEAHREQKTKSPAKIGTEISASVYEFADNFCTVIRMSKIMQDQFENDFSSKNIGDFLKALQADVYKEATNELADSGIEWKTVAGAISKRGVAWFKQQQSI